MKILVTGAAGFAGRYLVKALQGENFDVIPVDLDSRDGASMACDISSYREVNELINKYSPDQVFHLAAVSHLYGSSSLEMYRVNLTGTLNLLEASSLLKRQPRFIMISSSQVYGQVKESKLPAGEDTPVSPENHYGSSKAAAENLVRGYCKETGMQGIVLRPFNHTGRGQLTSFLVPKLVEAFSEKKKQIHLGNLNVARDIMDIRDVISAYLNIAQMDEEALFSIFNIAGGHATRLSDIFEFLVDLAGYRPEIISDGTLQRKNEISVMYGSSDKLKDKTAWSPVYTTKDTVEWMYNENR